MTKVPEDHQVLFEKTTVAFLIDPHSLDNVGGQTVDGDVHQKYSQCVDDLVPKDVQSLTVLLQSCLPKQLGMRTHAVLYQV